MTGTSAGEIPILDAVLPYIAVRVAKRKRWDDEEGDAEGGEGKKAKKQHGRKGRVKNKAIEHVPVSEAVREAKDIMMTDQQEDPAVLVPADVGDTPELEATPAPSEVDASPTEPPEPALVLRRIQTVEVEGTQLIVFNVVGYVSRPLWKSLS